MVNRSPGQASPPYPDGWSIGTRHRSRDKGPPDIHGRHGARTGCRLARGHGSGDNGQMEIHLNGAPRTFQAPLSVLGLLEAEGLAARRVAVEVNGEIVPRSRHGEWTLADGDRVEIVHALGGG